MLSDLNLDNAISAGGALMMVNDYLGRVRHDTKGLHIETIHGTRRYHEKTHLPTRLKEYSGGGGEYLYEYSNPTLKVGDEYIIGETLYRCLYTKYRRGNPRVASSYSYLGVEVWFNLTRSLQ